MLCFAGYIIIIIIIIKQINDLIFANLEILRWLQSVPKA